MPLWVRALGVTLLAVVVTTLAAGAVDLAPWRPVIAWGTLAACAVGGARWIWSDPGRRAEWQRERTWWIALLVAPAVCAAVLWPRLAGDGLNGDGTEAFEIARSAQVYALPHWEIEAPGHPTRYGVHIVVPYFTGAALAQLPMGLLGAEPLAVRLLMPVAFAWVVLLVAAIVPSWSAASRVYLAIGAATVLLWSSIWVSYDPPFDLAEPAGTNLVTVLFFTLGLWEALRGFAPLAGALWVCAGLTTVGGPVLALGALLALVWTVPVRARKVGAWTLGLGTAVALMLLAVGVATGDLPWWATQLRGEYWRDFVGNERRVDVWPLFWRWGLVLGGAPLIVALRWREVPAHARVPAVTALGYALVVGLGADKALHYLMPVPFLVWPAALIVGRPRELALASVITAVAFAGGWPARIGPDATPQALGRESCVVGLDFAQATVGSAPIEDALASPRHPDRLGVSRHAWVWHALTDGSTRCVLGLSAALPPGATPLVRGDRTVAWTTDLDAFVAWRFLPARWTTALWFPRPPQVQHPVDVHEWPDVIDLQQAPGDALVMTSSTSGERRLLVPAGASSTWVVSLESGGEQARTDVTVLVDPVGTWAVTAIADEFVPVRLRRMRE